MMAPPTPSRILVVDDDPSIRTLVRAFLLADLPDLRIEESPDGKDALERTHQAQYDAIISDYSMPGLSGIELARALKSRGSRTPVVLMTGSLDMSVQIAALAAGCTAVMRKPFSFEAFREISQGVLFPGVVPNGRATPPPR